MVLEGMYRSVRKWPLPFYLVTYIFADADFCFVVLFKLHAFHME